VRSLSYVFRRTRHTSYDAPSHVTFAAPAPPPPCCACPCVLGKTVRQGPAGMPPRDRRAAKEDREETAKAEKSSKAKQQEEVRTLHVA